MTDDESRPTDPEVDDRPAPPPRRRPARLVLIALAVVAGVLLADIGVLWLRLDRRDATLGGSPSGGTTWLLIGSDRRVGVPEDEKGYFGDTAEVPGARADIILAVRISASGAVSLLGIPRDLLLVRTKAASERLATTLQYGPGAIADALCNSLGLGTDHLAMVEFDGLRDLVDLVGGVSIDSDAKLLDRGSGLLLRDGTSRLDGRMALAYVRARNIEVWDGDRWVPDAGRSAERSDRAMAVLSALASGVDAERSNPWSLQRLAWVGTGALTIDGGTGPFDLLDLADAVADADLSAAETLPARPRVQPGAPIEVPQLDVVPATFAAVDAFQGKTPPPACRQRALIGVAGG